MILKMRNDDLATKLGMHVARGDNDLGKIENSMLLSGQQRGDVARPPTETKPQNDHIGVVFQNAREASGYSIPMIADILKIKPTYLAAIETLDRGALPSMGYVLGFVRSYSRHLGLDENAAVERFKHDIEYPTNIPAQAGPHHIPRRKIQLPQGMVAAFGVMALGVVIASLYGWRDNSAAVVATGSEAQIKQSWAGAPQSPTKGDENVVSLLAEGPSWVQVKDKSGAVLMSRIMVPGELFETKYTLGPTIDVRDGGAIMLYRGGQLIGPLGQRGESARNLSVATRIN